MKGKIYKELHAELKYGPHVQVYNYVTYIYICIYFNIFFVRECSKPVINDHLNHEIQIAIIMEAL